MSSLFNFMNESCELLSEFKSEVKSYYNQKINNDKLSGSHDSKDKENFNKTNSNLDELRDKGIDYNFSNNKDYYKMKEFVANKENDYTNKDNTKKDEIRSAKKQHLQKHPVKEAFDFDLI